MGQNGQGPSLSSADLSKKRKRGRPRKDENLAQENSMPAARTISVGATNGHTGMLGQVVSGYIDGMFEGGYLITVKVGDTYLRGLAFLPGRVVPITAENDVAPHAKMIRRHGISTPALDSPSKHSSSLLSPQKNTEHPGCIPLLDSQSKQNNSTLPSEVSEERPCIPASMTLDQVTPAQPLSAVTITLGNQSTAFRVPSTDNSHRSDTGSSLERIFFSENTPGSELENRASAMSTFKLDKFCEQNKVPHDFGALYVMGGGPSVCQEQTEHSKEAMGLGSSIEPTLDLGHRSQSASSVQTKHDNFVVQDRVLQNSEASTLMKEANMSLGLKDILEQGALEPSCADFLGKFQKNGSPLKDEAVVSVLEVDKLTNDGVGKPDLQLNRAFNHAEFEKPFDMPGQYIGPMTDINAPSENITKERLLDPSLDVCNHKTKFPDRNLPNDVAELKQAASNPACTQAISAESKLPTEGSTFTEACEKQLTSSALKTNLLTMTSDMETISSEPRLAAEASRLSNVIKASVAGSSSGTK